MREIKPFSQRYGRGRCGYPSNMAIFSIKLLIFRRFETSDDDFRDGKVQKF